MVREEKLGSRFDQEAAFLDGWAHRTGCPQLPAPIPARAHPIATGGILRHERCPRECPTCPPSFLTLLSHQVTGDRDGRYVDTPAADRDRG